MRAKSVILALVAALALGACTPLTARTTVAGGLLGGGIGLLAGASNGDAGQSAAAGALLGAATGLFVGVVQEDPYGYGYRDGRRYRFDDGSAYVDRQGGDGRDPLYDIDRQGDPYHYRDLYRHDDPYGMDRYGYGDGYGYADRYVYRAEPYPYGYGY